MLLSLRTNLEVLLYLLKVWNIVKLLETHKDKKLRNMDQWVCLMKEIREVLQKVTVEAKLLVGTICRTAEVFQNIASNPAEVA